MQFYTPPLNFVRLIRVKIVSLTSTLLNSHNDPVSANTSEDTGTVNSDTVYQHALESSPSKNLQYILRKATIVESVLCEVTVCGLS